MSLSCANNRNFCVSNSSDLRTIADVCIKVTSGGTPRRSTATFYEDGIWPWVKTKELVDGWLNHTEEYITEVAVAASSAKILPEDTILMAMYGATVGKLGILSRPMACNQACCGMIVDSQEADFRYLFYQLQYVRPQIKGLATGAAQQNLSMELIKSLQFAFPSLPSSPWIKYLFGDQVVGSANFGIDPLLGPFECEIFPRALQRPQNRSKCAILPLFYPKKDEKWHYYVTTSANWTELFP